ncbi:hypothetical protein OTK49_21040 [Vibrio coralliirubri]|uniref:hypothetical protein n=1 Tax=Vibrio coralliirubri TaxID=1516159 RepID=UPI002284CC4E|nr:hypothetical protein [Vibrio coralliirubri]MCY9865006.1 hypothetical protein [Vibrio coralliirubri]
MNTKVLNKGAKVHKFVVDITTDGDLEVANNESGDLGVAVIMEWVGDSRESVLAQAQEYLANIDNYRSEFSPEDCEQFVETHVKVGLEHITSGVASHWSSKEEHDVNFTYIAPEM